MNRSLLTLLILILAGLSGCAESERQQATGRGTIRALNASPTAPNLGFLLEERVVGVAQFKNITVSVVFDDLDYIANFDYQFTGELQVTRLASVPFKLDKDTDHLFIYTGTLAAPATLLWQRPSRVWDGTETIMAIEFGHLSPQLGEVDVYFSAPGTLPVAGESLATLSNGNHSIPFEISAGDYELILTSSGNPGDILYTSNTTTYLSSINYLASIFDGDPSLTSPISVGLFLESGASVELTDANVPPTLRTFHAAFGTEAFDLFRDSDFSAPLIANVANNEASPTIDVPEAEATYTFTPVGNVGATLHEEDFAVTSGRHNTRILLGEVADLATTPLVDDFRWLEDSTRLRVMHAAFNQQTVNIFVVKTGVDIAERLPQFFSVNYQLSTGYANFAADSYELYATTVGTRDVLAGPFAVDFTNGDVVHFALVDTADPNVVEFIKYDHRSASAP
jgi:hypothetical protein